MAVWCHAKIAMSIYGSMRGDKGGVDGIYASGEATMLVRGGRTLIIVGHIEEYNVEGYN